MSTHFDAAAATDARTGHTVVTVSGDVDMATAPRFGDVAVGAMPIEPSTFVVDLSDVAFMDSSGVTVLVVLRRKARSRRIVLRLVTNRRIDAVLRLAGLTEVFEIHGDLAAAMGGPDPDGMTA